jgi:hypothetical protein
MPARAGLARYDMPLAARGASPPMHSDQGVSTMLLDELPHAPQTTRRTLLGLVALIGALALCAVLARAATAATHEYCLWDGGYCANSANTRYYAQGENLLVQNYAWLVYLPSQPIIYCGANLNGAPYASFTQGNPSCTHSYGGGNLLKAVEYVSIAATTHGQITY